MAVVQLNVRIDPELKKKIKLYCLYHNYKMEDFVAMAIEQYIEKHGGKHE